MSKAKVIAFYLPQYRPVEENNKWFGKGFTEWTSVAKAKPLFKNHYQPKVPADLGFYDLRLADVKEQQVELAKEAGVSAFCYYHYWFGNKKTILEETLQEVVASGKPDFPFCLCWANESWYRKCWHSDTKYLSKEIIFEQEYPGEQDYDDHFYFLLDTFKDPRYYKVNGKLVFVIYNLDDFQKGDVHAFMKRWQDLAKENGLPGFFFISYSTDEKDVVSDKHEGFDARILSLFKSPSTGKSKSFVYSKYHSFLSFVSSVLGRSINAMDYGRVYHMFSSNLFSAENIYPVLVPNWDNTPRRGAGGMVFYNSTPENFRKHIDEVFRLIKEKPSETNLVFLKSWNEWGEGNYMEPDLLYGHGYIDELRNAIEEFNKNQNNV